MSWTKAEKEFFDNWRSYSFDDDVYKYGYTKPKEIKTIDQIYSEYPKLREKFEGKKDKGNERKSRKTRRKQLHNY